MDAVGFLLYDDMNADRLFQLDAIVVDETFSLEATILPLRKGLPQPRLGNFEQAIEAGEHFRLAVFCRESVQAPLPEPVGAKLPADVAEHELGRAAVGTDDAIDVSDRLEAALIAHGGEMQAFVEGLARLAGAASRHRAADIALVRNRAAETEQCALAEHRTDHAHVGCVRAAALVRVIDQEGVALGD